MAVDDPVGDQGAGVQDEIRQRSTIPQRVAESGVC
jgi:hypothetical protein